MIRLVIGIVFGVIMIIFAVQNTAGVDFTFLAWTMTAPRAVFVIGIFFVGLFSGWLVSGFGHLRRRK